MKKHPVRQFVELKATLPLDQAEAVAAVLNGTPLSDTRVRGFRRQLNAALRKTDWIGRLESRNAATRL